MAARKCITPERAYPARGRFSLASAERTRCAWGGLRGSAAALGRPPFRARQGRHSSCNFRRVVLPRSPADGDRGDVFLPSSSPSSRRRPRGSCGTRRSRICRFTSRPCVSSTTRRTPAYGFAGVYRLNLLGTEYLLYYVVGDLLAFVMGVKARSASVALMCFYLGGMPLALRSFLRSVRPRRTVRLALFAVAARRQRHVLLRPHAVRLRLPALRHVLGAGRQPSGTSRGRRARRRSFSASTRSSRSSRTSLPFALFGVGCIALFLEPAGALGRDGRAARPRPRPRGLVGARVEAAGGGAFTNPQGPDPLRPHDSAIAQFTRWSTNIFSDQSDEFWAIALGLVALAALGLSAGDRESAPPIARAWFIVPRHLRHRLLFARRDQLGDVWMFGQRFAVPALFTTIPASSHAAWSTGRRGHRGRPGHRRRLDRERVQTLHRVRAGRGRRHRRRRRLDRPAGARRGAHLPRRQEVADDGRSLRRRISTSSRTTRRGKGGVVQFAYTGFPHWPVQYEPGMFPPPASSRAFAGSGCPRRSSPEDELQSSIRTTTRSSRAGRASIRRRALFTSPSAVASGPVWSRD